MQKTAYDLATKTSSVVNLAPAEIASLTPPTSCAFSVTNSPSAAIAVFR